MPRYAPLLLLLVACSRPDAAPAGEPAARTAPPAAAVAIGGQPADSATTPRDPGQWRVTEQGIGPLRAGMSRAEAEDALGSRLALPTDAAAECAMAPLPGAPIGTAVMLVNDTLARVDVFGSSTTATAAGARIGDTADRILSLYPERVRARPHKYTAGRYLVVTALPDTTFRLLFETDEQGLVTRYRSGRLPEVEWVEACG